MFGELALYSGLFLFRVQSLGNLLLLVLWILLVYYSRSAVFATRPFKKPDRPLELEDGVERLNERR